MTETKNKKSEEKEEKVESPKEEVVKKEVSKEDVKTKEKPESVVKTKKELKKKEPEKPKKTFAMVNGKDIPISTKDSVALCKFIKNKKIEDAIADLESVLRMKKPVPMKGEIPHKKGKGMSSGRFPKNASENFIKLLKSLSANANYNGLEEPIIFEAVANTGKRPYGRFGRIRKKRTHIRIVVKDKPKKKKKEEKK